MLENKYMHLACKLGVMVTSVLITMVSLSAQNSWANPISGVVSSGSATISSPNANTVQINQHSNKAIINWQTFNISSHQTTRFQQPSAGSIAVNRVDPNNGGSTIAGHLIANGQIWILNPAGILITPTAHIDVAGFLATTAGLSDADFMNGNYHFIQSADWHGSVINEGNISVADGGMAALVAPAVSNSGVIHANLGKVTLGSGNEFVVDFYGDQLINFSVNSPVTQPGVDQHGNKMTDAVSNSGTIIANGGTVTMTANTAADIVHHDINMSGTIVAGTASMKNGEIILSAPNGNVQVSGKLIASGKRAGETGGIIKVLGKQIAITDNAKLDASGYSGGGEILVGGNAHGAGPEMNADYVYFGPQAVADASAINNGNGGKVVVWSNLGTGFYGNIYARGGSTSGNGGFVETSGKAYLDSTGMVSASAANGSAGEWLLDPFNVTISNATANGSFSGGDPNTFTPSANNATVNVATIDTSLNGGTDVTITTGTSGTQAGNITLSSAILKNSGATTPTLTLDAAGTIALNNNITATSGGINVVLIGSTITVASSAGSSIATNGGSFNGTSQNAFNIGSGTNVGTISTGAGTVTIAANADGAGAQDFVMTSGSTMTTTDTSGSAVNITVNTSGGGTGQATLAGITTGSGGTITVATNPSGTNGSNILFAGSSPLNAGTGTVTLSTGVGASHSIGTSGANILISAGTLNASTGNTGIFVTNSGSGSLTLGTISATGPFTLTSTSSASISQTNPLSLTGTMTMTAGSSQNITLSNSGNSVGTLILNSANNVSFTNSGALALGASNISGTFDLTAGGSVTETGALSITGTPTFTLTAATTDISLATQANDFSTTPVITNNGNVRDLLLRNTDASAIVPTLPTGLRNLTLTFNNATSLALPGVTLTGSLSVTDNGPVTQTGAVIANATGTTQTFAAGAANDITLNNTSNDLRNVLITNADNVTLQTGTALIVGASTISGNFNLTTGGAITNNGALVVSGTTTLSAGTANNITLGSAGDDFNTVAINSANNVSLTDINSIIMGTSTTNGTLSVTSSGAITQSGIITSTGAATFAAGAANDITLNTFSNNFSTFKVTTGNNILLNDASAVILGTSTISGTLGVTAGGTISQSGALTVTGTPTFTVTAASSDISLASSANNFATTPVITNNGNVRDVLLRNTNASSTVPTLPTGIRNLTLTFNNATSLALPAVSISGNLSATDNGPITQTGAVSVTGTSTLIAGSANDITLTNASNDFGTVTITSGNNVSVTDSNALIMSGTVSGTLNVTTNGALTQSAALNVTGLTTLNTNSNNITWNTSTNNFGSIAVTSGNNVNLRDANSMVIAGIFANGTLTLQANGTITQSSPITAVGTATLIAGAANNITLTNSSNSFSTVAITSGNNVSIANANSITLGTSTVNGTFGVSAGGSITQSGIQTVTGTPTFTVTTANSDILLATSANVFSTTPVFTNNGNIRDLALRNTSATATAPALPTGMRNLTIIYNGAGIALPAVSLTGTLTVTVDGAITQTGDLSGTTLTATTLVNAGANITLANSGNDFSTIALSARNAANTANAAGAISYTNSTGFSISTIDTTSTVTLVAGNAITQSGTIAGTTLTATTLNDAGAAITLTNTANVLTSVDLLARNTANTANTAGAVSFTNNGALIIAGIATSDTATLIATNTITQSGSITANNLLATTERNAGASITLNNSSNAVSNINLSARNAANTANAAGAITYVGASGFNVTGIATTDTVTLIGGNTLTQTGAMTGSTLTATTLNDAGAAITFSNNNNNFTSINLQSRNAANTANASGTIAYQDSSSIIINGLDTTGNASLTANGTITDSGSSVVGGTLDTSTVGGFVLTHNTSINELDSSNSGGGNITLSSNSIPLTILGITQSGGGTVNFTNTGNVSLANGTSLVNNGGAVNMTVTGGILSIGNGTTINSNGSDINITANDLNLNTSGALNSGSGNITITQNTASGSIGLGNTAGTMTISGAQLNNVTANSLTLVAPGNGQILVDGITATQSNNISRVTLNALSGTSASVNFLNNASTFKALTVSANNGINLSTNITTSGNMIFGSAVNLESSAILTGSGITFNNTLDGAHDLSLNAGSSGNITFNGNVGNINPLTSILISNANNVTNNGSIISNTFTQTAGSGTTAFGTYGITTTGASSFSTNNVTGAIFVNSLSLGTNFANMTGTIAGGSGVAAIMTVTFLNTITAGTHFFNGIDMYLPIPPTPPVPPTPSQPSNLPQTALPTNIASFNGPSNTPTSSSLLDILVSQVQGNRSCKLLAGGVEYCQPK